MIKKTLFLALFFGLFISCAVFAAEKSSIGTVIMVQGQASATDTANVTRTLQRRSEIYLNDIITTAEDSKVQLHLKDDSMIVVQPLSKFSVSEFAFDENEPKRNRYVGNIVQGALVDISGQGEPENYQLKSPLAAITFRGTGLATKLHMKDKVPVKQDVNVFKGYVTVVSICDKKRAATEFCEPRQTDIGAGQKMTAAMINTAGNILPSTDNSLMESFKLGKVVTQGAGGSVSIKCNLNK